MNHCPCGWPQPYEACCGLRHKQLDAKTPEQLMRSRYSAFVKCDVAYIQKTQCGEAMKDFHSAQTAAWTRSVYWQGLTVLESTLDPDDPARGAVHFIARYLDKTGLQAIEEHSEFRFIDGQWFYTGRA